MARQLTGRTVTCRPNASNTFTDADNANDVFIAVSVVDGRTLLPEPQVVKSDGTNSDIYGQLFNWDAGAEKAAVQTTGIVRFRKNAAAVTADIGKGIEGHADAGKVGVAATGGLGRIIARGPAGTNEDVIFVDLDKSPI